MQFIKTRIQKMTTKFAPYENLSEGDIKQLDAIDNKYKGMKMRTLDISQAVEDVKVALQEKKEIDLFSLSSIQREAVGILSESAEVTVSRTSDSRILVKPKYTNKFIRLLSPRLSF